MLIGSQLNLTHRNLICLLSAHDRWLYKIGMMSTNL